MSVENRLDKHNENPENIVDFSNNEYIRKAEKILKENEFLFQFRIALIVNGHYMPQHSFCDTIIGRY